MVAKASKFSGFSAGSRSAVLRLLTAAQLLCALLVSLAAGTAFAQATTIDARLSASTISEDQTVTLTVEATGDVSRIGEPETDDFEVIGRQSQTSVSFVNGQMSRRLRLDMILRPLRTGSLNTGEVSIYRTDGERDTVRGINIEVTSAPNAPRSGTAQGQPTGPGPQPTSRPGGQPSVSTPTTPTFPSLARGGNQPPQTATMPQIRGTAGNPAQEETSANPAPYIPHLLSEDMVRLSTNVEATELPVIFAYTSTDQATIGEPFIVDFIYLAPMRGLGYNAVDLSEPAFRNAWFRDVSQWRARRSRRLGTVRVNGEPWDAQLLRSYAVVPLSEGDFDVPSMSVTVEGRSLAANRVDVVSSSDAAIRVSGIPEEGRPPQAGRNVGRYVIESRVEEQEIRVGDTVELRLTVRGFGIPAMLTLPASGEIEGARVLDPEDEETTDLDGDSTLPVFALTRRQRIQAQQEGVLTIPPYSVSYFDPWSARWQTLTTREHTVLVEGVNPEALPFEEPDESSDEGGWQQRLPSPLGVDSELSWTARLRRQGEPWPGNPVVWGLLLAPFALLSGTAFARRAIRKRRAGSSERKRQSAAKRAIKSLSRGDWQDASSFAQLGQELRRFVATRSGGPALGATYSEFETIVADYWTPEEATHLRALLETAEESRYAGADAEAYETLRVQLIDWLRNQEGAK